MKRIGVTGACLAFVMSLGGLTAVSASATAVCYEEVAKCPAANRVPVGKKIEGHNLGNIVMTTSNGNKITCTTSEFEDEIQVNNGGALTSTTEFKALVFGGCKESVLGTTCKIKNVPEPPTWVAYIRWTKNGAVGPNGEFEPQPVEFKVECKEAGVTCVYQGTGAGKRLMSTVYNAGDNNKPAVSEHSEIYFNQAELVSVTGGAFCGAANAKEKGVYSITDSSVPSKDIYVSEE